MFFDCEDAVDQLLGHVARRVVLTSERPHVIPVGDYVMMADVSTVVAVVRQAETVRQQRM